MENPIEKIKGEIIGEFDKVIEDSDQVREILKHPENVSQNDLEFARARIGNNKTINVALNGKLTTIRLTEAIKKNVPDDAKP